VPLIRYPFFCNEISSQIRQLQLALFSCKHLLIEVLPLLWLQVVTYSSVLVSLRVSPHGNERLNKRELDGTNFLVFRFLFFFFFPYNATSSKAGNTELATCFAYFTYYLPLLYNGNILELSVVRKLCVYPIGLTGTLNRNGKGNVIPLQARCGPEGG